jgi:hypothetical protein
MNLLKKISLTILILLIVLIALLQTDDSLNPETKTWIKDTEEAVSTDNNAYFYFIGMMAPENKDPVKIGKAIHQKVLAQPLPEVTEEPQVNNDYYSVYKIDNGLQIHPENLCKVFNADCFKQLEGDRTKIKEIINSNATLLKRYQTFLAMPNYQLMHPIGQWHSMPYYQHVVDANNINLIALLAIEDESLLNQKFSQLLKQTRLKLAQSGSLIEKMIYVALVNHNLELYNLLYKSSRINNPIKFEKLSVQEKSFDKVMGYETLSGLAPNNGFKFPWYAIISKAVIKRNMMLNYRHQYVTLYNQLSLLPPHKQLEAANSEEYKPKEVSFLSKYRNYSGWILNEIADSAYTSYIFRVSDLDAKIAVLNWRLQQPQDATIDNDYLKRHGTEQLNPYQTGTFTTKKDTFYRSQAKESTLKETLICINTEYPDPRNVRCVQQ